MNAGWLGSAPVLTICLGVVLVRGMQSPAALADEDLAMIVERVRGVLGIESLHSGGAVVVEGSVDQFGSSGRYRFWFDASGRFVQVQEAEYGESAGFDGVEGWAVDWSGMPRQLELRDLDLSRMLMWIETGLWSASGSPVGLTQKEPVTEASPWLLELRLEGARGAMQLAVNRKSGLPLYAERDGIVGTERWEFEDYREFDGLRLPGTTRYSVGGVLAQTYQTDSVRHVDSIPDSLFAELRRRPDDTRFHRERDAVLEVRRAPTGHLLVRPRLNGQEAGWYLFDTGAGVSVVTPATVERLGLEPIGTMIGATILGVTPAPVFRLDTLDLGPLSLSRPGVMELDLSPFGNAFGTEIGGIVGFDVLSRSVVEIETGNDRIALHAPETYRLESGAWREVILHNRHPHVPARWSGDHTGLFKLDVGAAGGTFGNVTFHTPTVRRLGLVEGRAVREFRLQEMQLAIGTIDWFELAGERFDSPEVVFSLGDHGPFRDAYSDGNIGVEFLRPFRIVLDYPRKRIALVPAGTGVE